MRTFPKVAIYVSLLLGVLGTQAHGQEVKFSDVFKMEQTAMTLLRAVPHRSTRTSWVFPERGKEATWKSTLINEILSAERSRWVQINESPGSFKRMEVVSIGGKHYRRVDDAPWHLLGPPPSDIVLPPAPTPPKITKPRFENTARLVETISDKSGLVSVYETISKSTLEENGVEVSKIHTIRYWFRHDGMLLRKDMELETIGDPKILRNSTVYEYDGIKIEAPVLN